MSYHIFHVIRILRLATFQQSSSAKLTLKDACGSAITAN